MATNGCKKQSLLVGNPEQFYSNLDKTFLSGNLAQAERDAKKGISVYSSKSVMWDATFRVELARVLLHQGKSAEAVAQIDREIPTDSAKYLTVRRNLLLAIARSRLEQDTLSDQAIASATMLHPEGALLAETMAAKGSIALYRGDLDAAERLFENALAVAHTADDKYQQSLISINLGLIAMRRDHYQDAAASFNKASSLAQLIGARFLLEKAFGNLGWIYYQIGDLTRAIKYLQASETLSSAFGVSLDEAQTATNLGMIEARNGNKDAALASYNHALSLAETLRSQEKVGGAHVALAYLLLPSNLAGAESHIREASRIYGTRKGGIEQQEVSLLASLLLVEQGKKNDATTALLALQKQVKDAPWLRWQTENTLATLYAESGKSVVARMWFERAIETFHRQRDSVGDLEMQLPFFENGSDLYLSYMEYLIRQGRTGEALTVLDRSRAESLAEGLHREAGGRRAAVSSRVLAGRLGGTILVYCLRPQHSYLWAIDSKREAFRELAGSEVILPLVERQTQAILASKDLLAQKDATATALYQDLVRPAEALVKPGGRVFLIPDKGLSGLNFETLVVPGERPHYWIEDVSVTNARSLRLLAARRGGSDHAGAGHKMLLIGNPMYRAEEYAPLPNAAAEMTGVSAHFTPQQRTVFSGAAASPAAYAASEAAEYSYIHFVAHATADAMNPLDSAVILSSPPGGAPYKLYAADILRKPLNVELVTISSCYGSGVRNYAGEGVVGLVWAFLRAGAHSVIGALWEVSDVSTPRLMDAMYGELLRGEPPDEALRSAKLTMLHDKGVFRKPLYWAPFQLYAGR